MPPASTIATLPPGLRDELNSRLVLCGFSHLEMQAKWLRSQGVKIGKSAVGEYSKGLKASLEKSMERARTRVEVAKAMGALSESDKAALLEANEMVLIDKLMDIMDEWDTAEWSGGSDEGGKSEKPALEKKSAALAKLIRAAADIGGSARSTVKLRREIEAEARRQALEEAARIAEETAKEAGVSQSTRDKIRAALGMAV